MFFTHLIYLSFEQGQTDREVGTQSHGSRIPEIARLPSVPATSDGDSKGAAMPGGISSYSSTGSYYAYRRQMLTRGSSSRARTTNVVNSQQRELTKRSTNPSSTSNPGSVSNPNAAGSSTASQPSSSGNSDAVVFEEDFQNENNANRRERSIRRTEQFKVERGRAKLVTANSNKFVRLERQGTSEIETRRDIQLEAGTYELVADVSGSRRTRNDDSVEIEIEVNGRDIVKDTETVRDTNAETDGRFSQQVTRRFTVTEDSEVEFEFSAGHNSAVLVDNVQLRRVDESGSTEPVTTTPATGGSGGDVQIEETTVLSEDFNDNQVNGRGVSLGNGSFNFRVSNGRVTERSDAGEGFLQIDLDDTSVNANEEQNFSISVDVDAKTSSGFNNGVGVVFGYQDGDNYFRASYDDFGTAYASRDGYQDQRGTHRDIRITQVENGQERVLGTANRVDLNNSFNFQVDVDNGSIRVSVDGTEQVRAQADDARLGQVGLYTNDNDNGIAYDNVEVKVRREVVRPNTDGDGTEIGNRLDEVSDRADANGRRIDDLEGRVDANEQGVGDNSRGIDANGRRINDLEGRVDANGRGVGNNSRGVDANGRRINDLEGRVDASGRGVSDNSRGIDANGQRIDDLDARVDANEQGVGNNSRGIDANGRRIDDLDGRANANERAAGNNSRGIDANGRRIDDLDGRANANERAAGNNSRGIDANGRRIDDLDGRANANERAAGNNSRGIDANGRRIDDLDGRANANERAAGNNSRGIDANGRRIDNLDGRANANEQAAGDNSRGIDANGRRIDDLDSRANANEQAAGNNSRGIEANGRRIDDLGEDIKEQFDNTNSKIDNLENKVDEGFTDTNQRIDDLSTRQDDFRNEVNDQFDNVGSRFDQVDSSIDSINDRIDEGFDSIEEKISQLDQLNDGRYDGLEGDLNELKEAFTETVQDLNTDFGNKIDDLSRGFGSKIDELKSQHEKELSAVLEKLDEVTTQLVNLAELSAETLNVLDTKLGNLGNKFDTLVAKFDEGIKVKGPSLRSIRLFKNVANRGEGALDNLISAVTGGGERSRALRAVKNNLAQAVNNITSSLKGGTSPLSVLG